MLRCWRDVERQGTPYTLVPMSADNSMRFAATLASAPMRPTTAGRALGMG